MVSGLAVPQCGQVITDCWIMVAFLEVGYGPRAYSRGRKLRSGKRTSSPSAGRCDGNALKLGRSDKRSPAASSLSCNLPLPDSDKFFPTCDILHRSRMPL